MAATARFQSRDQSSTDVLLAALDGAAVGVWQADLVSNRVVQSDTVGPLFGRPRGPVHSTLAEWRASILPEDLEAAIAAFALASTTDGRFSADYRVRWPDGSVRWLTSTGRIDKGADGAPVRAVGILKDSTARKEAEAALVRRTQEPAQSEAQYRMMGEAIPYGVWLCDAEGQARYVSPSFRELLEMNEEEQAGFGWTKRYDPTVVKAMMDRWMYCVRTGEPWEWEHRLLGPDKDYHTVLTGLTQARAKVEVALDRETDGWRIAVGDTGPGIPVDAQARIFEPFVQLEDVRHKHTPGVGLGLALARRIIESLGGSIQVHSEPGTGSIFAFTLRETRKED